MVGVQSPIKEMSMATSKEEGVIEDPPGYMWVIHIYLGVKRRRGGVFLFSWAHCSMPQWSTYRRVCGVQLHIGVVVLVFVNIVAVCLCCSGVVLAVFFVVFLVVVVSYYISPW